MSDGGETAGREYPKPPIDDGSQLGLLDPGLEAIVQRVAPFTMTGPSRIVALVDAVRYLIGAGVEGEFAECGVWRGGSVMAMVLALQELGAERRISLFDTFEGMTEPTEHDSSPFHEHARETWEQTAGNYASPVFDGTTNSEASVRETLTATGYPEEQLEFVAGPVEETIPGAAPERLALLRLDTDWYESTIHELEHLYPRLVPGGVMIIDDYGHWDGSRRAVDEYFGGSAKPVLLQRIDYTARLVVKT